MCSVSMPREQYQIECLNEVLLFFIRNLFNFSFHSILFQKCLMVEVVFRYFCVSSVIFILKFIQTKTFFTHFFHLPFE